MATPGHDMSKAPSSTTAQKPKVMPVKRRLNLVGAVVVLVLLPSIVMVLVTWAGTGTVQGAATWASMPAIVGIAAVLSGGTRLAANRSTNMERCQYG
jgi:hypothetical protein